MDSGRKIEAGESKRTEAEHRPISLVDFSSLTMDSGRKIEAGEPKRTEAEHRQISEELSPSLSSTISSSSPDSCLELIIGGTSDCNSKKTDDDVVSRKKELNQEFKEMISQLPDEPTLEDYLEVPVEGFGHHYEKLYSERRD